VNTSAIEVSKLTKKYGDIEAVRGIDFEVATGETFGFLGPNGAGKSTTIKILCTLADPTSGTARVAGYDVVRNRDTVRRNIGLVFQDTTLDSYLTGEQNLRFHADLYGVPKQAFGPRLRQVLEMVALWDRKDSVVATYSGGMKRRLEIARGLLFLVRRAVPAERTARLADRADPDRSADLHRRPDAARGVQPPHGQPVRHPRTEPGNHVGRLDGPGRPVGGDRRRDGRRHAGHRHRRIPEDRVGIPQKFL
jgi:ABC-type polar amino acid transport system ATPase subunit